MAVWNGYDLGLLDLLNEEAAARQPAEVSVAVFDVDTLDSPDALEHIIPGIGIPYQSPVVGYWDGGQLKATAWGFEGRQLVARVLGLDERFLHQRVTAAS